MITSPRASITKYVGDKYRVEPDYLWAKFPDYAVLRHRGSGKWFALLMKVPKDKLKLEGSGEVDVVNVKCKPEIVGSLRMMQGYLPAYHMNKEHWLTILLDGTVAEKEICEMIDNSYELTVRG